MGVMTRTLARTRTLVLLVIVTACCSVAFKMFEGDVGGRYLDLIFGVEPLIGQLGRMNAAEKAMHVRMTLTADVIYPLAYAGLISSLLIRLTHGRVCNVGIGFAVTGAVADYIENGLEVAILSGHEAFVPFKAVMTTLKFGLLGFALFALAFGIVRGKTA